MLSFFWNIIIGSCFHRWGEWEIYKHGKLVDEGDFSGYFITQIKTCEKCKLCELREAKE